MNKSFTKLAQSNVDHYNNHPTSHTVIAVVGLVVAYVGITKLAQRMAKNDLKTRMYTGRYAK